MPSIEDFKRNRGQDQDAGFTERAADTASNVGREVASFGFDVATNAPRSILQLGQDYVAPILSPIDTVKSLGQLGLSALALGQNVITGSDLENDELIKDVGRFYADRYGGLDNALNTIRTDPAGAIADLAFFARLPQLATKAAKMNEASAKVKKFADRIEPINYVGPALKGGKKVTQGAANKLLTEYLGLSTGAGAEAIREALNATPELRASMRGEIPDREIIEIAKQGVDDLQELRDTAYRTEIENLDLGKETSLNTEFTLNDIIAKDRKISKAKAGSPTDNLYSEILKDIELLYDEGPLTVGRLNEYKQRGLIEYLPSNFSDARGKAYTRINKQITQLVEKELPEIKEINKKYANDSEQLAEIRKNLNLGDKAKLNATLTTLDRSLRLGDDVTQSLIEQLPNGTKLRDVLAGRRFQALIPENYLRLLAGGAIGFQVGLSGLPVAATLSPRFVGEATVRLGDAARFTRRQGDRISSAIQEPIPGLGNLSVDSLLPTGNQIRTGLIAGRPIGTLEREGIL